MYAASDQLINNLQPQLARIGGMTSDFNVDAW